ncbi:hypothetical protein BUALT_Bualt01G0144200 [Buddleja alternifolia]|uniref:Uncharacterized protein n=1 Tax=Buddleja alternifolia TaxID=168488 RepID=A0AAV6Y770_9LAMI|nr:hypothetical protein BUALT_Bualt01G0144200 [Buddleja alternifolia]
MNGSLQKKMHAVIGGKGKIVKNGEESYIEERQIAPEKIQEKGFPDDVVDVLLRHIGGSDEMQPLDFIGGNIIEMMIPGEETVPTAMTLAIKFLTD